MSLSFIYIYMKSIIVCICSIGEPKYWINADTKTSTHWYRIIAKTRAEFSLKVSTKRFTQNYCFQESGWRPLPVAHQITGHTDFPWKYFEKTLMWRLLCRRYHGIVNLTFYSFGWRLLLCQHETLSSKSVVFFVWKPLKYYNALSLSTLYEELLPTKTTISAPEKLSTLANRFIYAMKNELWVFNE